MKRFATLGILIITSALSMPMAAQQKPSAPALEIRTLSTRPEFVSGGDVLVQITGPATLTVKNITVRVNGKDASAAFKPGQALAPSGVAGLVGLLTGLQVGSNAVSASMRGNKTVAQLTIINHPITGPVLYSPHQTPFACETPLGIFTSLKVASRSSTFPLTSGCPSVPWMVAARSAAPPE